MCSSVGHAGGAVGGSDDDGGMTLTITKNADGVADTDHGIRKNDTIIVATSGGTVRGLVESVTTAACDTAPL